MRRKLATAAFAASLIALAVSATADTGPAPAVCPVEFERSYEAFEEFEYDTRGRGRSWA